MRVLILVLVLGLMPPYPGYCFDIPGSGPPSREDYEDPNDVDQTEPIIEETCVLKVSFGGGERVTSCDNIRVDGDIKCRDSACVVKNACVTVVDKEKLTVSLYKPDTGCIFKVHRKNIDTFICFKDKRWSYRDRQSNEISKCL